MNLIADKEFKMVRRFMYISNMRFRAVSLFIGSEMRILNIQDSPGFDL